MLSRKVLPLVFLTPLLAQAATPKEISLCHADEQIVFSCAVDRLSFYNVMTAHKTRDKRLKTEKILSLCATNPITLRSGQLWYRFGNINKTPDFTYPDSNSIPVDAFTVEFDSNAKGSGVNVTFKNHDIKYSIINSYNAFEGSFSGIEVDKGRQQIATYSCNANSTDENKNFIDNFYILAASKSNQGYQTITFK